MNTRRDRLASPTPARADGRRRRQTRGADHWQWVLDQAVAALEGPGWGVIDHFLPETLWHALAERAEARFREGDFHDAGIGAHAEVTPLVRGDAICWLAPEPADSLEAELFARIEDLRLAINRRLWLGLMDYECHYARYPVGAHYQRHLDQVRGRRERTVTLITYLNRDWRQAEGGALRIYPKDAKPVEILPQGGRAVIFLSAEFEHEVLPARRPRLALTGWFRRRPYTGPLA